MGGGGAPPFMQLLAKEYKTPGVCVDVVAGPGSDRGAKAAVPVHLWLPGPQQEPVPGLPHTPLVKGTFSAAVRVTLCPPAPGVLACPRADDREDPTLRLHPGTGGAEPFVLSLLRHARGKELLLRMRQGEQQAREQGGLVFYVWRRHSPVSKARTPAHKARTPAHKARTPARKGRTPARKGRTPAHKGHTPAHKGHTPAHKGDTPVYVLVL